MREQPWHIRQADTENHQWYKNLKDLHELTRSWLEAFKTEALSSTYDLHNILNQNLEELFDDTLPGELLTRLEHQIKTTQALTLATLLKKNHQQNETLKLLLGCSWKAGHQCAKRRWPSFSKRKAPRDFNTVFLALRDSPFSGYPNRNAFLVKRVIVNELQLEFRECPHQLALQASLKEINAVANELCILQHEWIRGYINHLDTKISVEYQNKQPRCIQRWR